MKKLLFIIFTVIAVFTFFNKLNALEENYAGQLQRRHETVLNILND